MVCSEDWAPGKIKENTLTQKESCGLSYGEGVISDNTTAQWWWTFSVPVWLTRLCEISPYHNNRTTSLGGGAPNWQAKSRVPSEQRAKVRLLWQCLNREVLSSRQAEGGLKEWVRKREGERDCVPWWISLMCEREQGAVWFPREESTCWCYFRGEYTLFLFEQIEVTGTELQTFRLWKPDKVERAVSHLRHLQKG